MQLHQLKPIHKPKKSQKIGRGGKRGTYSGRGIKGQTSRAGHKKQPIIRELIKRYPKLRGYRFKSKAQSPKSKTAIVNLDVLEKKFKAGQIVSPETLKMSKVKILGKGEITKALIIENCNISKSAGEKIKKAGGIIK